MVAKEQRLLKKEIGGKIDRVSRQKMATKAQLFTRYDTVEAGRSSVLEGLQMGKVLGKRGE